MRSNRIRTTALAATALIAVLSLTACGGDDGADATKPAPAGSVADQGTASPAPDAATGPEKDDAAPADAEPAADNKEKAPAGTPKPKAPAAAKPAPKAKTPVTCTGANTKTTVTKVSRPINHLLLTVTNTGDRLCYAYYAPMLRFDGAQAVFQVYRDSRPQAVVTLDPGASAYAGIALTGEPTGKKPYKSANLGVTFADRANAPVNSSSVELKLPGETYWDDNGFVTYWQSEMADALTY